MASVTRTTARPPAVASDDRVAYVPGRRIRAAEWIAFTGLVAAFIGALGPAEKQRSIYAWPPERPLVTRAEGLYAPLLLASRIPEKIELEVPCNVRSPRRAPPMTVMATARHPERAGGLLVANDGEALFVQVGTLLLSRVVDGAGSPGCTRVLLIEDGRWSFADPLSGRTLGGKLRRMPVVNGVFSHAATDRSMRPSIRITTRTHSVGTTWRQGVAWVTALLCGLASLALVAGARGPWLRNALGAPRRCARVAHAVDAFVGVMLLTWWLIAPAFYDDGWTIARQSAFETSGSFSNYYESFGVGLPLGYWVEWLQHWVTRSTDALVVMRLPTLLCLVGIWVICRWIFSQIHGPLRTWTSPAPWALGVGFAAMVMAWGMSLRQEPAVALLVTAVVACAVRFVETRSSSAIALTGALVPLALTAHPTGIVVLAPLIAIAHECVTWARARPAVAVTVLTAAGALALALAFLGSDVEQRALDAQTLGTFSTTIVDWREELSRYSVLTGHAADYVGYAAPLRRCAVALMLLACLAYLLRRSRQRLALLDLPARTLVVALLLFVATPSKWPWHFGALVGIVTLAVAAETVRWRDARPPSSTLTRSVIALIGLVLVALWSWSPRGAWNAADLQTLDWTPRLERLVPLGTTTALLPLVFVAVGLLTRRMGKDRLDGVPGCVVSWAAPVLVIPIVVFTVVVLLADAARTREWTTARQNIGAIRGTHDCGLAEDLQVPRLDSIRPLQPATPYGRAATPTWVPPAPVAGLRLFALGPTLDSTAATPWFTLSAGTNLGLFVSGRPAPGDRLALQWGKRRDGTIVVVRRDAFPIRPTATEEAAMPWALITHAELRSRRPRDATMVRVELENDAPPAGALAVTTPFGYSAEPLARRASETSTLALPHVVTFFPCVTLPRLQDGVAEPPGMIITTRAADPLLLDPGTSPFRGLLDTYHLQRLPIARSLQPIDPASPIRPTDIIAYTIDPRIRGWVKVQPVRT